MERNAAGLLLAAWLHRDDVDAIAHEIGKAAGACCSDAELETEGRIQRSVPEWWTRRCRARLRSSGRARRRDDCERHLPDQPTRMGRSLDD